MLSLPVQTKLCNGYQVHSSCDVSLVLTELLNVNQVTQFIPSSWRFRLYDEFHNIHQVTNVDRAEDYLEVISMD